MLIKVFLTASMAMTLVHCAKLLRTPKVYNAVITTDGNEIITPSKAYPLIQPVPVYTSLYPTSFYNFQSNVKDVQQLNPETRNIDQPDAVEKSDSNQKSNNDETEEKVPIKLNKSGFPPSLIPIKKVPSYPYSYPFIFDSYGNLQAVNQYPVLPPQYYPQQEHQLPAIEQPLFRVSDRRFENFHNDEIVPNNGENSLPAIANDASQNLEKVNTAIPPISI